VRVALVHDWLVSHRGGENVLAEIASLYPDAPIYTLVHSKGTVDEALERHPIETSFIQDLPGSPQRFRPYLPLFPRAIESFDLSSYDLVLSTSHCVAKGVRTRSDAIHVSYVHTPMRYLWDQLPQYLPNVPGKPLLVKAARALSAPLRAWDVASAERPTHLLANSSFVAKRIAHVWGQHAEVIYPPVDVGFFAQAPQQKRRGLLVVSALVPYKRVDLAVTAATKLGERLTVVGRGSEARRLQRMAGPTVEFVESLAIEKLRNAFASAEALLFCGVEDFGIVPVEAMAAGCPVIGLKRGGLTETVVGEGPDRTGVFFETATTAAVCDAIIEFRRWSDTEGFRRSALSARANNFGRGRFRDEFAAFVSSASLSR